MSDDLEKVPSEGADSRSTSSEVPGNAEPVRTVSDAPGPSAIRAYNQFNIQQIPPSAIDKLSSGDVVKIFEASLDNLDAHSQRLCEVALNRSRERGDADKRQIYVGGSLAALGFVSVTVLACLGQREVAVMLVVFLATVIGVTVGGKSGR